MISLGHILVEPEPIEARRRQSPGKTQPDGDGASPVRAYAVPLPLEEARRAAGWDADDYAENQIRSLIQQVFFPGWPRPARQVVFSGVDPFTECAGVCSKVACQMARQLPGTVCAVEANPRQARLEQELAALAHGPEFEAPVARPSRAATPIANNLWLLGIESFLGPQAAPLPAGWLRSRLSELRREFDYTVIHAPPAGSSGETAVLGQLSDGIILILSAHKTRRVVARRTQERLQAANVRLLGLVLDQRTFPIPELMYRSL
jgi:hypothetical protein